MYEIGMSYMGMQILYNIVNGRSDCLAERAFAVWPDMEELLKRKKMPLFSLESATPLSEFDILGFHLTYEMTYTTMLSMLDLAGIPLRSAERSETDPLILAGGPSMMNPEPMADFIDAFFIGDAEEGINEIIDRCREAKAGGLRKDAILQKLSQVSGIYVPGFYKDNYDKEGRFTGLEKLNPNGPDKIKVRSVPELKPEYYPSSPVLPFVETTHDHLSIEIMRGCVRGCRFCQAGYQYRPRRQRPVEEIVAQVSSGLRATGYEDVTLLSLSSTDYDDLGQLLGRINPQLTEQRVSMGLPSLRPETINVSILELLSSGRRSGLTLAPEAGTERLRGALGKKITDRDIYHAFEMGLSSGWQTFKLYFMIGLPTETDEDIEGMVAILRELSILVRKGNGRIINVALSPFNPKSHTPFQWERQVGAEELQRKVEIITRGVGKRNVNIRCRNIELSRLEGILGRGDRRLGKVIFRAFEKGARLEGWSEWFDPKIWQLSFIEGGVDPESYTREIDEEAPLAWDHIDKGISKEFLQKDNHKAKELSTSTNSNQSIPAAAASGDSEAAPSSNSNDYGRKPKRISKQSAPGGTYKLRIRYSRGPELRFLSHLDTIRALYRAFRRAELPLSYTEGFHPHVKVSFGQPLPLGYTSEAEYLDLQLTQPYREEFVGRLKGTLPHGLTIMAQRQFFANVSSLSKLLNLARYEAPMLPEMQYDSRKLSAIAREKSLVVTRIKEGIEKRIDAGQFLQDVRVENDRLVIDVWQMPEGHIKPEEVLIFGLEIDKQIVRGITIHRKGQYHKSGVREVDPMDLV
jgi:radical SAM family uncharacterized protein/radical SAM-linked protein